MKPGPTPDPNVLDEPVLWAWGLVKQFAGRRVVDGGAIQSDASGIIPHDPLIPRRSPRC